MAPNLVTLTREHGRPLAVRAVRPDDRVRGHEHAEDELVQVGVAGVEGLLQKKGTNNTSVQNRSLSQDFFKAQKLKAFRVSGGEDTLRSTKVRFLKKSICRTLNNVRIM